MSRLNRRPGHRRSRSRRWSACRSRDRRRSTAAKTTAPPAKAATAKPRPQGLHAAANAGRPAGPPGLLDELHVHAARAAEQRDQGVLHAGGSSKSRSSRRAEREERADRARHHRRRALRLHAVRAGPEPVDVREEPAHVADRRPAEREASAGHAGGTEAGRRPRGREEGAGRSVRRRRRTCRSDRAASSWRAPARR